MNAPALEIHDRVGHGASELRGRGEEPGIGRRERRVEPGQKDVRTEDLGEPRGGVDQRIARRDHPLAGNLQRIAAGDERRVWVLGAGGVAGLPAGEEYEKGGRRGEPAE